MGFANNLRTMLKKRNMTQAQLAAKLNISESIVSQYVNGNKIPDTRRMFEIARILRTTADKLWNG